MLTGQRFQLTTPTLGIETNDEGEVNRQAVRVPAGETIMVTSGPRPDDGRMVDVLWRDKTLVMFYEDVKQRGARVEERSV